MTHAQKLKPNIWFLIIALLSFFAAIFFWRSFFSPKFSTLEINQKTYHIEVMTTPAELELGLSGRSEIGSDGMLFVFGQPITPRFWMKDMKFDLDMVWIAYPTIVEISANVPKPAADTPLEKLPNYQPNTPVTHVLEVPAGFAAAQGWQVGDEITFKQ